MSESRLRILGRLRTGHPLPEPAASAAAPMRTFDWDSDRDRAERLERFVRALESVRGEVHRVGADWPRKLFELLRARGVDRLLYGPGGPHGPDLEQGWPDAAAIGLRPWPGPVEDWRDELFDRVPAAFSACRGAIAETGSLVLWPDAREPRLLSLVPPIHAVLLDARAIRSTLAELMAEQGWSDAMPTNALLITGPSKSADIEQTLTYGVHGPESLIVLVRTEG
jgi:L-lactate dehydrogenase complex protein LldG